MQLSLTSTTLLFFLTHSLASPSVLLRVRQATFDLPNSLYAFNLDSANDHTIDAQCDTGFAIVNSKVPLKGCLTNINGELSVSALNHWHSPLNKI
jgi:hypothetical protein